MEISTGNLHPKIVMQCTYYFREYKKQKERLHKRSFQFGRDDWT